MPVRPLWLPLILALSGALRAHAARAQEVPDDPDAIPRLCQVANPAAHPVIPALSPTAPLQTMSGLPAGTRSWECIPGVIRNDGVETFRIEVDVNGPVQRVWLDNFAIDLVYPGASPLDFHDDGLGADLAAGDNVWTAGPFRYNTSVPMPANYRGDSQSPAGLSTVSIGFLHVQESDGTIDRFLIFPSIGILRSDIPVAPVIATPTPDVSFTANLVDVKTTTRSTENFLRSLGSDTSPVTTKLYAALPDVFDFVVLIATDKVERTPYNATQNFVAGEHLQVSSNFTGTTWSIFNNAAAFGSAGKLMSVNAIDAYDRGLLANVVTHEITHQWASYTDPSLGLSDGTAHYNNDTSVGSLVGGFLWTDNGGGTFLRNCNEGRNGAHHAPPLDLYFAGLIDASGVSTTDRSPGVLSCTDPIAGYTAITMAAIQAAHGVRTPGPATSQKSFNIGFVAETHGRFFNATERTFFDILAAQYTKLLQPTDPDPYHGFNWPTVTRYFGHGTSWRSDVLGLVTSVADPPRDPPGTRLTIGPNPARGALRIQWQLPAGAESRVEILDLHGRRVRLLARGRGGAEAALWDGRDDRGEELPVGVYLARATGGGATALTHKLIWLR